MAANLFESDTLALLKTAQDSELHLSGLYAEIAKNVADPALQPLIYSMAGDAYGHFRILAIALMADPQRRKSNR